MPRDILAAHRTSLEQPHGEDQPLAFIELTHPDLDSPIYVVNDTGTENGEPVQWEYGGNLYTAFPFSIELLSDNDGPPTGQLEIANVDQTIGEAIRELQSPVNMRIIVLLPSDFDTSVNPRTELNPPGSPSTFETALALFPADDFDSQQGGWVGYTLRTIIPYHALLRDGNRVRFAFEAAAAAATHIGDAWVGYQMKLEEGGPQGDQAVYEYASDVAPVQITFNGGSNEIVIAAGQVGLSDWIEFDLDRKRSLLVAAFFPTDGDDFVRYASVALTAPLGWRTFSKLIAGSPNQSDASNTDTSGYTEDATFADRRTFVHRIEVQEAEVAATQPIWEGRDLVLREVEVDALTVRGLIRSLDDTGEPFPSARATQALFPGLYR